MQRKFAFASGEYYHLYNRGTDKREIFRTSDDHFRFIRSLYLYNSNKSIKLRDISKDNYFSYQRDDTLIDLGAYCLMPNHFHLLVRAKDDTGVSIFMKKILTSYSMYFNARYDRTGSLFQGPFKAQYVGDDEYLKYLFAYIHLNPVKLIDPNWKEAGISDLVQAKKFLHDYKYSSYQDYLEIARPEKVVVDKDPFPKYFDNKHQFDDLISSWLEFEE